MAHPNGTALTCGERIVDEVLGCSLLITSIWRIGDPADAGVASRYAWDLIAFGDVMALHRLRRAGVHRPDVRLRVVTDGDQFETAWGNAEAGGSLAHWGWTQENEREAYYSDAHAGGVRCRGRLKAVRLWSVH